MHLFFFFHSMQTLRGPLALHIVCVSVGDPWHFGPDPDIRIRTCDQWIRIRIQLLSSLILRMQNFFSSYFFLITCSQAHHLQSKKNYFLLNFCVKILFYRHYFNKFMRKGKDPDPDPDLYLWLMDPDPDPGAPITCGSGSGSSLQSFPRIGCFFWPVTMKLELMFTSGAEQGCKTYV